jgi:hypothetical protein
MGNPSGSFLSGLLDFIQGLFGGARPSQPTPPVPAPARPSVPSDNTTEPLRIVTARVLLVVYDPIVDGAAGTKLSRFMGWSDVDTLVNDFCQDILALSSGNARFQVVQKVELNEFPALTDGFRYAPADYLNVVKNGQAPHRPEMADYASLLTGLNVLPRIAGRDIDEIWLMGFPYAGFYESIMGGAQAFWCNANPLDGTAGCERKFVVMGFSYERGVGEMLHSFGHRCESILTKAFEKTEGDANLYARFSRYEKLTPGQAEVGLIHFAPNSEQDYDWNNSRMVASNCYDWYNFPNFKNDVRQVNAGEWGNGDIRAMHSWWLKHLPKVAGRTSGVANNWWQYILDPNLINL